ncbi:hypothetical protein BC832DRAFT_592120 [Gaertneriomyces semiglobifer]|nr:hypothetical protein BC832DRAFT_592120 [Gaertneriomyces semiglobifer]
MHGSKVISTTICQHYTSAFPCWKRNLLGSRWPVRIPHRSTTTRVDPDTQLSSSKFSKSLRTSSADIRKQLLSHPASYLVSFTILHELTAIVPLPAFYFLFKHSDLAESAINLLDVSPELLAEGQRRMTKMMGYLGYNQDNLADGVAREVMTIQSGKMMFDLVATYVAVKVLMPVRVAISLGLTPWFARTIVIPVQQAFKRVRDLSRRST